MKTLLIISAFITLFAAIVAGVLALEVWQLNKSDIYHKNEEDGTDSEV